MRAGRLGVMVLAGAAWASIGVADDLVFQAAGEPLRDGFVHETPREIGRSLRELTALSDKRP